jgi:hypothetical protein
MKMSRKTGVARLSLRDASLLMDVLEQQNLPVEQRRQLLDEADPA